MKNNQTITPNFLLGTEATYATAISPIKYLPIVIEYNKDTENEIPPMPYRPPIYDIPYQSQPLGLIELWFLMWLIFAVFVVICKIFGL